MLRGFSLIELVIVIVIIAGISAIAFPRMTRGADNAGATAFKGSLSALRNAIEIYRAEHEGRFPNEDTTIANQLTMYTPALQKSACLRGWFEGLEAVQESLFHLPATANRQR